MNRRCGSLVLLWSVKKEEAQHKTFLLNPLIFFLCVFLSPPKVSIRICLCEMPQCVERPLLLFPFHPLWIHTFTCIAVYIGLPVYPAPQNESVFSLFSGVPMGSTKTVVQRRCLFKFPFIPFYFIPFNFGGLNPVCIWFECERPSEESWRENPNAREMKVKWRQSFGRLFFVPLFFFLILPRISP